VTRFTLLALVSSLACPSPAAAPLTRGRRCQRLPLRTLHGKDWQDTYHCHEQKAPNRKTDAPVKKSRENICHDAGSPNYSKLQYFVSYKSMKQCTSSGGRPTSTEPAALEALLVSTGVVALAEIGDKTQLLALLLATSSAALADRARHPGGDAGEPAFASAVGTWLVGLVGAHSMRWILGLSFIAMALWTLIRTLRRRKGLPARATACS
jgi:hypothetical protein